MEAARNKRQAKLAPLTPDLYAAPPQRPKPDWSDKDMVLHFKTLLFRERRRHATCESVFARTVRDQDEHIAALQRELFVFLAPRPSRNPSPKAGAR